MQQPSPSVAQLEWNKCINCVNSNSICEILKRNNIDVSSSVEFSRVNGGGVVNPIFTIKTHQKGNPHRFWEKIKIECEVESIRLIASKTTVPVPVIICYESDATASSLGFEYILMEKVQGTPLHTLENILTPTQMKMIAIQIANFISQFRQIKYTFIGGIQKGGRLSVDGPSIGPFLTWKEYMMSYLKWSIGEFKRCPEYLKEVQYLISPLEEFQEWLNNNYKDEDLSFAFTHAGFFHLQNLCNGVDLNPSNILVNPETMEIVAILDFEHARSAPLDEEWPCTQLFSENEEVTSFFIEELKKRGISEKNVDERKKIFEIVFTSVWTAFWTPSWFEMNNCTCEESAKKVARNEGTKLESLLKEFGISVVK